MRIENSKFKIELLFADAHQEADFGGDVGVLLDAGEVEGAGAEGEDGNHAARVVVPKEADVVGAGLDVAVGEGEAAGLVVGGDDDEGVAVALGEVDDGVEHLLEVGEFGAEVGGVVVVAGPVDLRPLDHQCKALGVAAEEGDGLFGGLGEHVAAGGFGEGVVVVEETDHLVASEAVEAVEGVDHGVAAAGQGVERREAVLAVLRLEVFAAAADHDAVVALGEL